MLKTRSSRLFLGNRNSIFRMFACLTEHNQMSSINTGIKNVFVVAINQHRILGNIFIPIFVTPVANSIYNITEILHGKKPENFELTATEQEILKICNEYSEKVLAEKFAKTQNTKVFIEKMVPAQFDEHIRPYIEKRMHKVAGILANNQHIGFYLKDKKYNNIYEDNRIVVEPQAAVPIFNFALSTEGLSYHIHAQVNDQTIPLTDRHVEAITNTPSLLLLNSKLYRFDGIDSKKLTPFFTKPCIVIPTTTVRKYMESFVLNAVKSQVVNASGFDIIEPTVPGIPILTLEKGLDGRATLSLKFSYDNRDFLSGSKTEPLVTFGADQKRFVFTKYGRNTVAESAVERAIASAGLIHYTGATYIIKNNEEFDPEKSIYKTVEWLNEQASNLNLQGIKVGQAIAGLPFYLGTCQSLLAAQSDPTGFIVKGGVRFGDDFVLLSQIRKCVIKGQKMVTLESGKQAIIPQSWFKERRQLLIFGRDVSGNLHLQKQHFSLVEGLEGIDSTEIDSLKQYSETDLTPSASSVKGVNATLRDYQKLGFAWLKYLHLNSFGGCLADDMGLGKTLQTISLLQHCKDNFTYEREASIKPSSTSNLFSAEEAANADTVTTSHPVSLIVVPTSLVHNWRNELRKFAPNIKIHEHIGATRAKSPSAFSPYDVVITSYGIVRNDLEMLQKFKFYYLILDESQTIKNPDSATYKACMEVNTHFKLSLSGTPIENGLTDLWAQMNFLNKGLLGNLSLFKEQYVIPIEKFNHMGRQEKLKNLIEPFILRRTKEKVASELPAVTELEIICEMTDKQRDLYDEEKRLAREKMISEFKEGDPKRARFVFLQLLTKLRQIANHPSLAGYEGYNESGKFEEITRNIENVINEGHKVLVFSSFVQHLKLVANYLDDASIRYNMLTGSTSNRQQVVDQFKTEDNVKVFLISLKAGGVGLNLTEADYVFIIDPWWNPAAENQAISRSHRIGQENRVFAYRFITSNSIEERIIELQRQKSELADIFVNTNNPLSKISEDILLQLL